MARIKARTLDSTQEACKCEPRIVKVLTKADRASMRPNKCKCLHPSLALTIGVRLELSCIKQLLLVSLSLEE
jgi:hypothetical protein